MGSRERLCTLGESADGIIKAGGRQRSGGYSVHTSGIGRLPDLISFSSKLTWIRDILTHKVGPDVWWEMIEKEAFKQQ